LTSEKKEKGRRSLIISTSTTYYSFSQLPERTEKKKKKKGRDEKKDIRVQPGKKNVRRRDLPFLPTSLLTTPSEKREKGLEGKKEKGRGTCFNLINTCYLDARQKKEKKRKGK